MVQNIRWESLRVPKININRMSLTGSNEHPVHRVLEPVLVVLSYDLVKLILREIHRQQQGGY